MKLALLLNVIEPQIGGALVMGHRGTGKSTAVRGIAELLPQFWKVTGCPFGCDPADEEALCNDCVIRLGSTGKLPRTRSSVPVVTLPLGATEDRVCGTINIESALKEGVKKFEPGLLARANRGFLYVDEVNLLDDHLVDLLLDVAVTGRNTVEREGVSLEHPAHFVLVGSGNPEEGELRPQLVDRFGLCAQVQTIENIQQRFEIVELRESFARNPERFCASKEKNQQELRRKIVRARTLVGKVTISKALLKTIAEMCLRLKIDGHRGELTIVRAARALAALEGRRNANTDDVRRVAMLALRHRLRNEPLDPAGDGGDRIEQAISEGLDQSLSTSTKNAARAKRERAHDSSVSGNGDLDDKRTHNREQPTPEHRAATLPDDAVEHNRRAKSLQKRAPSQNGQPGSGSTLYNLRHGRYSCAVMTRSSDSRIAIDATLRALARRQADRTRINGNGRSEANSRPAVDDLRYKLFKRKQGTLFILAVDSSGSMALNRIERAKGALIYLLKKAYVNRDRVALVGFHGQGADEILPPSQSMSRARRAIDGIIMGGATPLASGIECALNIARRAKRQSIERIVLLIFTDGRANIPARQNYGDSSTTRNEIFGELEQLGKALKLNRVMSVVVDTRSRFTSMNEGRELASRLDARYLYLSATDSIDGKLFA